MQVRDCPIPGLKLVESPVFRDARGFFAERFHAEKFAGLGLPTRFVQDNHSRSVPGVLRGVHYQHEPAQGKLVTVLSGCVWDVAVDIRPESPSYGRHHAVELSGENGLIFWIPPGFAHGFCVLGDAPADMLYKVTAPYGPKGEGGIRFDDPALAIPWPVKNPIVSDRDKGLGGWEAYATNPPAWGA